MKYKTLVVSLTKEVVGQGYHDLSDPSWEAAQIDSEDSNTLGHSDAPKFVED